MVMPYELRCFRCSRTRRYGVFRLADGSVDWCIEYDSDNGFIPCDLEHPLLSQEGYIYI